MCIICTSREEELLQLKTLDCSGCVTLKVIPLLPSLQTLYCYNCSLLVSIPLFPSLQYLSCYNCPLLVTIPLIPSIQTLVCSDCPLLMNIPVVSYYTHKSGCRWLNDLTLVTQVIICQKYIKSSHRARYLSRALKDKRLVEWLYSPEVGGKYIKRDLLRITEKRII
jgi:hypothetical protein